MSAILLPAVPGKPLATAQALAALQGAILTAIEGDSAAPEFVLVRGPCCQRFDALEDVLASLEHPSEVAA